MQASPIFRKPNSFERTLNKAFGILVGLGIGLRHNYLLQVPGRRTGRIYSIPIDLLEFKERRFLVAPRGRSGWVRNVESARVVVLKKGRVRREFRIGIVAKGEKPEILKAYLHRFELTVKRYFPVPAGSELEAFAEIAERYPVFELLTFTGAQDDGKERRS